MIILLIPAPTHQVLVVPTDVYTVTKGITLEPAKWGLVLGLEFEASTAIEA